MLGPSVTVIASLLLSPVALHSTYLLAISVRHIIPFAPPNGLLAATFCQQPLSLTSVTPPRPLYRQARHA